MLYIPTWNKEQLGSATRVSIFSYKVRRNKEPERLAKGQKAYNHEISCYVKLDDGRVERKSTLATTFDTRKARDIMESMLKRQITKKYPAQ